MPDHIIIDFDSTFTRVEALDLLAVIALRHHPDQQQIAEKIHALTVMAMEGRLPFDEALKQRVNLLPVETKHLTELVGELNGLVSESFRKNRQFIADNANRILVLSGGFREFIVPVVSAYGIAPENVYANTFVMNDEQRIVGYDTGNPLAQAGGKVTLVKSLSLSGKTIVIGDGFTDYEIRQAGLAVAFYLFTENVRRESLCQKADLVVNSLDEIIATFQ